MDKVSRIYNIAKSIISVTGAKVVRLDIQHFTAGPIESYVGYLETAENVTYRIKPSGDFEVIIK